MLEKDDHRRLGRELDLFHFQAEAPGAVFWHPRGLAIVRALEDYVRRAVRRDGYEEVRTPQLLARSIWEASGHWEKFAGAMMRVGGDAALKPVSCPGHIQIVRRLANGARRGPIRLSEFGVVHRNERKSQLLGLFRLRQFVQDDGHVFCAERDVEDEVARFVARVRSVYAALGFDEASAVLSLRPSVRAGDDAVWDRAEAALRGAVRAAGLSPEEAPGAGAFYGPKLELVLSDRRGRAWQCGTIQLDFVLPERFGIPFVMLHRAMLGSVERFLGIVLEQYAGRLPAWLAPEQIRVLAVAPAAAPYAEAAADDLRGRDLRVSLDVRAAPLAARVERAHADGVPVVIVAGPRDREARRIALRIRGARRDLPLEEGLDAAADACAPPGV